jgi:protein TonB
MGSGQHPEPIPPQGNRSPHPDLSPNQLSEKTNWPLALAISLLLHFLLFFPLNHLCRQLQPIESGLVEVSLIKPAGKPKKPAKSKPQPVKPTKKHKTKPHLKAKTKKKPLKKRRPKVVKKAPLARKKRPPRKHSPATNSQLNKIKKKLARQQEEERLAAIRKRLRNEPSVPISGAQRQNLLATYQQLLKAQLMRHWHLPEPLLKSGLEATVSLTITASGRLVSQQEEKLSGNLIFDNAMRQAIINATPFPPFPAELKLPEEEFVITFNPRELQP